MRYYKENGQEFIVNGRGKLFVGQVGAFTRTASPGRVLKIFAVKSVVHECSSPIRRGQVLCLSFPEMHANARDYTWERGKEECQVSLNIQLDAKTGQTTETVASDSPIITPP